jgi:hypothetical protein
VRKPALNAPLTIGPDSIGHQIQTRALVFGGDVPTATDYAVAASPAELKIGDAMLVPDMVRAGKDEYMAVLLSMLEGIVDMMKTNPGDIDVLLVGGVGLLAPGDRMMLMRGVGCDPHRRRHKTQGHKQSH